MQLESVPVHNPEELNLILGQSHFIKTVEDVHEVLAQASPTLEFGIAFCEASGPRLIRRSGNAVDLEALAVDGGAPIGVETDDGIAARKTLRRQIGYKL